MSKAVFPGSFDPVTMGHMDLIHRAADLFDELIIGVLINSCKEPWFTTEERVEMLQKLTKDIPNISVISFDGLLVDFMAQQQAKVIVRGLRNSTDFDYELPLAQANHKLNPKVDTIYLACAPEYSYISSSAVKEILRYQGDVSNMVPPVVYDYISNHTKSNTDR